MKEADAAFCPLGQGPEHETALGRWSALRLQPASLAVSGGSSIYGKPFVILQKVQLQKPALRAAINVVSLDVFEALFAIAL